MKSGLMHGGEKREEVVGARGQRSEGGGYFVRACIGLSVWVVLTVRVGSCEGETVLPA